jgi:hypothetical protein
METSSMMVPNGEHVAASLDWGQLVWEIGLFQNAAIVVADLLFASHVYCKDAFISFLTCYLSIYCNLTAVIASSNSR